MSSPNDSRQSGSYINGSLVQNEYQFEPGICTLPLAEQPPTDPIALAAWSPVVNLQLHAPYRIRNVRTTNVKENNPPVIPTPADTGAFVFVSGNVSVVPTLNTTFANFDWTVVTDYLFVENCVSRPQDGLVLGTQPFTLTPNVLNNVQYGNLGTPQIGAVAVADQNAKTGYNMGNVIVSGSQGVLNEVWGYNCPSFFPGTLFNSNLLNGGVE